MKNYRLPIIAECTICKALTRTLITELYGNIDTAVKASGWPLCSNECAFKLKVWLRVQTPKNEGETCGTVSRGNDQLPGELRTVPDQAVKSGVEAKPEPRAVL